MQGELVLAREGPQGVRGLGGQLPQQDGVGGGLALGRRRVRVRGQRRGRGEPFQMGAPEGRVGGEVPARQPGDVIAEGHPRRLLRRHPRTEGLVEGEDLADEQAEAPAIHQQVVIAPEEAHRVFRQTHGRQAHQRRTAQIQAAVLVLAQQVLEARVLFGGGQLAPVEQLEGQLHPRVDGLQGRIEALPVEGRSAGWGGARDRCSTRAGRRADPAPRSPSRRTAGSRRRT